MKVMLREFLRSLKKNVTRFLSILGIIALGVGFFAGINATKPDMIKSGVAFYDNNNLMDLRAMNPLGYKPADIEQLKAIDGISQFQPSYTKDLFLVHDESRMVARLYSMDLETYSDPKTLNKLVVKEGRLPEQSGEIVLALGQYQDNNLSLGQKVRFEEEDGNELEDVLKNQEYTIVGFIQSPLYITFERENTNIGSGTVQTYVYVPSEDFTMEYPTEYFFAVEDAQNFSAETTEYDQSVEAVKVQIDEIGKDVMAKETAEFTAELEDNKEKLKKEKADVLQKLDDAQEELDQAEQDLKDAEVTLVEEEAKGRQEIADGRQEILEGRQELLDGRQELLDGRLKYNEGLLKWQKGYNEYLEGKAEWDTANVELSTAKAQLDSAKMQIESGKAMLAQNEATIESSGQQIETFGAIVEGLNDARAAIPDTPTITEEEYNNILAQIEEVSPETADYIRNVIPYQTPEAPQLMRDFLDSSLSTINASYESAKASYDSGKAQYEQGKKDIAQAEKDYKAGLAEYNKGKKELDAGAKELASAKKKIDDSKEKLDETRKELDDADVKLSQAQLDLDNGQDDLDKGEEELETKLEEARVEISDGWTELEKGKSEFIKQKAEAEKELAEADEKILDAERKILEIPDQWFVKTRDGNPGYTSWFDNADRIGKVATVFPFFFFLVAALVSLTTMTRMVEEERTQAGTLKALGYTPAFIAGKYIAYALLASLIGSAIGLFIGFNLFPRVIIQAYQMMYSVPGSVIEFNVYYALLSVAFAVVSTVGATLAAIYSEIRERPASLMQPKTPPAGKRILLERITPLWSRLSFSRKVTFRNLFLYKKRFWMTVLGISGCTALILTGFGIKDSVDAIMGNQFKELFVFDQIVSVDSKKPVEERNLHEILDAVDNVQSYSLAQQLTMKVHVPGSDRTYDADLTIPENPDKLSNFIVLRSPKGEPLALPNDGVIITEQLADKIGAKIGDVIHYEDSDFRQFSAPVSAITENYINNYIYISPSFYQSTHYARPDYDLAWAKLTEEGLVNEEATQESILEHPSVLGIFSASETAEAFDDQMSSLIYVVLVLIISAGALAFIVLYNLSNVNITERVRELATIKVLGFRDGEVSAYVYRENIFLTLFGGLLGLGLGAVLHQFIIQTMEIDNMMFGKTIYWPSYIYAFALTFFFSAIVNVVMHFALKKINMVESLKSLE